MIERIREYIRRFGDIVEIFIGVMTGIAILAAGVKVVKMIPYVVYQSGTDGLSIFLQEVFTLVIAVEFLKMLCKPSGKNVIEVLVFVVSRHMIIAETTPFEDFTSVIAVSCLLILQFWFHRKGQK